MRGAELVSPAFTDAVVSVESNAVMIQRFML